MRATTAIFVQRSLEQIGRAQVNRRKSGPDTPISLAASQMSPKCFTSVRLAKADLDSARLAGSLWVDGATRLYLPEPLTQPPTRSATNSARNRRSSIRPGREVRTRGIARKKFLQAKHARGGPTRRADTGHAATPGGDATMPAQRLALEVRA